MTFNLQTFSGKGDHDDARQLIKVVRPSGLTTTNVFLPSADGVVRLQKTIDLEIGRSNSFTYANGLVESHTDARGLTTTNYWDNLQRLTGIKFPDGTTISNRYTVGTAYAGGSGSLTILDLTATKDRLNSWTYFGYNAARQKIAETNANNVVTRYDYCDCGALMAVTNAWHTTVEQYTLFGYDQQGNRVYAYHSDGYNVTNWFDALGRVITTGDGTAYTGFGYNNQGLLTSTSTANGARQITVYDIEDRPLWVTDANSVTITNTYDDLGRLRTRTYPDTGVEAFGYSARGLVAYTNQIKATNFFAYDEAGRKRFETNANWELICYTNSPAGDLVALVDGKNQVTRWNYDEYGRVTNKLDQAGTEILRYSYDAESRLKSRWSAAKGTTFYTNDAVGNLTYVNYPSSPDVAFSYDALNRVANMADPVGTTLYAYTFGGQLWTEDGPWNDDTVTNTFSNRLRVGMDLKQPAGVWTNKFTYDATRRLTNVTSRAGSFGYLLAVGAPSTLTVRLSLPNGSYITNNYDSVARLAGTWLKNSTHSTLNSHQYTYNPANQRTQQVFNTPWSTVNYAYDPIGQLKLADSASAGEDRAYDYDPAWNLTNRTVSTTPQTFQVDGLNQLTNSTPSGACVYDGNGNLVSSSGGLLELTYDDENRLSTVQSNLVVYGTNYGVWKTLYAYDGLGRLRRRVESQVTAIPDPGGGSQGSLIFGGESRMESGSGGGGGGHPWGNSNITHYIYDGWRVIQERNGSDNVPTVSYTRGTDLGGTLEGAGGIGGLLARSHGYNSGNWSTDNFYHADGNGNVTYLTSSSQTLAARYRYDPYGNLISSSEILAYLGTPNTYRFSSKMVDLKAGLYYYGYRWYVPSLQRWVNRDWIGEYISINLYSFVYNEPTDLSDSDGLDSGPRPGSKGGGPGNKPRPFKDRPGIPPRPGGEGDECHEWHDPGAICSPEWFLHQAGHGLMNFLGWCFSSSPPAPPPPAPPLLPPPDRGCSNCPQNAPPPIIIIIITLPTPPPPVHVNVPAFPISR